MTRILFAAAASFALASAAPVYAACADCPGHGDKVAAADKTDKKAAACNCPGGDGKECKCGAKCDCPHCHAKKAEKEGQKKT